ncbi:hypothetical protein LJ739_06965 [Aestuariibacter halophilus]|uniref:Transcription factor Pcc1 n=1 Tax=Fluctibacter halophilus TaxID=226011 RepID=A0ABS8G6E7_9ALTE|nr:hypothetical protein [Aestuariibacter halophilus]MCC2615978.1 hypothetical protein [Aestuariibacter halophilus]
MNYLAPGAESRERVDLMLSQVRVQSVPMRNALYEHLVHGASESDVVFRFEVDLSNFRRTLSRVNEFMAVVEKFKEMDWAHLRARVA